MAGALMGQAAEIIQAVVAALEGRRELLDDGELRHLRIEVKLNERTGTVRAVQVAPTLEAEVEPAGMKSLARGGRRGV